MRRRLAARGDSKVGCAVWLLLAIALGVVAWKAVPVKIKTAEFQNYMDEQAKFGQHRKPERIKGDLLLRAHDLGLPVDDKNLSVERRGDRILMKCSYTVPLELPFYTYQWKFEHTVDEPLFIF